MLGLAIAAAVTPRAPSPRPASAADPGSQSAAAIHAEQRAVEAELPSLERIVEQLRGHRFREHVPVIVLGDRDFVTALNDGSGPDTGSATAAVAAGEASSGGSYEHEVHQLDDTTTVGFYDTGTKRLVVRAHPLDTLARVVLVHELTHALDDQLFDLGHLADPDNADHDAALTALVEGDAEEVEFRYEHTLPSAQRCPAEDELGDPIDDECANFLGYDPGPPGWADDATAIEAWSAFPYDYGPPWIESLLRVGGWARVDAAFRDPPQSTEQIVDPATYLRRDRPRTVKRPAVPGRVLQSGVEGEFQLSLLLVNGHPAGLEGWHLRHWGGDAYATYRDRAGRTCLRDAIVMDSPTAAAALLERARDWQHRHQGPAAVVRTGPRAALLTSCSG